MVRLKKLGSTSTKGPTQSKKKKKKSKKITTHTGSVVESKDKNRRSASRRQVKTSSGRKISQTNKEKRRSDSNLYLKVDVGKIDETPVAKNKSVKLVETTIGNCTFELPDHYQVQRIIGKGAYGIVAEAHDNKMDRKVAVKKIYNVFDKHEEYQKRVLREVLVMRHFKEHENIVTLYDLIPPANVDSFNDVYIVTELMHSDMSAVLKSNQNFTDQHIKYFLYQILRGLKFIHSANVLHRDIKPSNILVSNSMDVKVCDFGLSRGIDKEIDPNLSTAYVASLCYRAPELLLMWEHASKALDIWSVGCIFAELLSPPPRKPFFNGKHYTEQLSAILRILGTPPKEEMRGCEKALNYLYNLPPYAGERFSNLFPNASPLAIDLLSKMLVFDPLKRIHVDDALAHPFLQHLHDSSDEPVSPSFNFRYADFEGKQPIKELIHNAIFDHIQVDPKHITK